MKARLPASLLAATLLAASAACAAPAVTGGLTVTLQPVAQGLDLPVGVTHAGDGSGRLFVVEQRGKIRVVDDGQLLAAPFLDLSSQVSCCGERGLLGLAFHPGYAQDGRFYVDYTDSAGNTVVAAYHVSANDPNRADPSSREVLFTVAQPFANHNGGQLAFGPDGYLYVGLGDGGSGGDPLGNGQNLSTLLGKILRIDVDHRDPGRAYAIPADNPFAGTAGARGEIWAYGLRNPWRFSFDRGSGDLFIGDVGQDAWEEIDLQLATSAGGENYGWNRTEGNHCYPPSSGSCSFDGVTRPILEYSHAQGCSVTGGFRYRGLASPALAGMYLYADYCSGTLWGAEPGAGGWTATALLATGESVSSFGEGDDGEVYLVEYVAQTLGWDFQDGDDLHPQANIDKMHAGYPLDDADRWPWLDRVAAWISEQKRNSATAWWPVRRFGACIAIVCARPTARCASSCSMCRASTAAPPGAAAALHAGEPAGKPAGRRSNARRTTSAR